MLVKLLTTFLLISWISSKIYVLEESELPELMKMLKKQNKISRRLEVADSGVDEAPKTKKADHQKNHAKNHEDSDPVQGDIPDVEEYESDDDSDSSLSSDESSDLSSSSSNSQKDDDSKNTSNLVENEDDSQKDQDSEKTILEDLIDESILSDDASNSNLSEKKENKSHPSSSKHNDKNQNKKNKNKNHKNALMCEYAGELRPGLKLNSEDLMMGVSGLSECTNPVEYPVASEVDLNANLKNCKGIEYNYMKNGEERTTMLYPIRVKSKEMEDEGVVGGYHSSATHNTMVYKGEEVMHYTASMGEVAILCMNV